ncbi:MAG: hypothetical protein GX352_06670 [Clostridiales bacterium]|nr:hypothetical protein [Clostridiales bacterium]
MNTGMLGKMLNEGYEDRGATICDKGRFKLAHNVEKKNKERRHRKVFLGTATIDSKGLISLSDNEIKDGMKVFIDIASTNLRKGDVISKWNEEQLALLLYSLDEKNLDTITQRLEQNFHKKMGDRKTTIRLKYHLV